VLFGSGTVGATFYNFTDRDTLRAAGLHVLERRWVDGWFEGATEGPQQAACGLAELIEHLRAELPGSLALCATGNSGGSVELGYALTWHGASASLDFALPTSGPFHRLDLACQGESNAAWTDRCEDLRAGLCPGCASEGCQVGGPRAHIDTAFDHVPRCTLPGAGDLAALRARSPLFGPSVPLLAGFPVQVLVGEADPGPYLPVAAAFALGLSAAGADVSFGIVPGGEHGLDNTLEGREAITAALLSHCGRALSGAESLHDDETRALTL
jgi:hypothetical protein